MLAYGTKRWLDRRSGICDKQLRAQLATSAVHGKTVDLSGTRNEIGDRRQVEASSTNYM